MLGVGGHILYFLRSWGLLQALPGDWFLPQQKAPHREESALASSSSCLCPAGESLPYAAAGSSSPDWPLDSPPHPVSQGP